MGNVCNSVLIGNSRIEDHVFCNAVIFCVSGQKNTRSLCSWILLSRASVAEHGMVVVMLRNWLRMKMSTPTSYTSQPILRSSVSWPPLGSNFGETWREQEPPSLLSREPSAKLLWAVHPPGFKFTPSSCSRQSLDRIRVVASCPLGPTVSASLRTTPVPGPNSLSSLLRPSGSLGAPAGREDH